MSFAQGLSSGFAMGTQLGNTIQDRRYTRDLAALQEQYKAQQAELQAPTPGAGQAAQEGVVDMPGVGLAIPGAAPVAQGQQVFDAAQQQRAAPTMSAMDLYQAQRGLAAKYNRVDELRRLDGLIAQQEQFSAQQAENDRRFQLQQDQFKYGQQRDAINLNLQQANLGLNQTLALNQDARAAQTFGREQASAKDEEAAESVYNANISAAINTGDYSRLMNPEGLTPQQLSVYQGKMLQNLERDTGVSPAELGRVAQGIRNDILAIAGQDFTGKEDQQLRAYQELATQVYDTNPYDDKQIRIVQVPDGSGYVVYEGNTPRAQFSDLESMRSELANFAESNPQELAYRKILNDRILENAISAKDKRDFELLGLSLEVQKAYAKDALAIENSTTYREAAAKTNALNTVRAAYGLPELPGAGGLGKNAPPRKSDVRAIIDNLNRALLGQ